MLLAHPWVGGGSHRMLWALGLTAWLLAMWIGITACVAMLFPVALAIAPPPSRHLTALLLFLVYAASAGAMATPVGTPPNLIGLALIEELHGVRLGFVRWMAFGLPTALILLVLRYGLVLLIVHPRPPECARSLDELRAARRALGPWTPGARATLAAFGMAIALWVGPGLLDLALGPDHPVAQLVSDRLPPGIAALLAVGPLFALPAGRSHRQPALRWKDAARIDWGTVVLFGGGMALGRLIFETGLAGAVGAGLLGSVRDGHPALLLGAAAFLAMALSETRPTPRPPAW
jgi:sodium-dependent dicarboxylate transporter 2/3/5